MYDTLLSSGNSRAACTPDRAFNRNKSIVEGPTHSHPRSAPPGNASLTTGASSLDLTMPAKLAEIHTETQLLARTDPGRRAAYDVGYI